MYHDFTVEIPDAKGKITIMKKGDSSFVLFEYERIYDSERKFNIPKRSIIGKISEEDASMMYPNQNYQIHFPSAVLPEERSEAYRSCCLRIGTYLVIEKVAQDYTLVAMLEKHLGKESGLLLDLACYSIINEDNAASTILTLPSPIPCSPRA